MTKQDNIHPYIEPINIKIDADRLIRSVLIFCISCELGFVILDILINYKELLEFKPLHRLCNIAREDSLASWFGTTQTFMVGLTLWLIVLISRQTETSGKNIFGWYLIAIFFTYMAVDDGAEIHERFGTVFRTIFETTGPPRPSSTWLSHVLHFFPSYAWQIVFLPFFCIAGVFILFFMWNQLQLKPAKILVFCALICFVIAVGLDFIEGLDKNHKWNIHTLIREKFDLGKYTVRHFSKSLEEFLEMLGITFFWVAFIQYFKVLNKNGVCFSFMKK